MSICTCTQKQKESGRHGSRCTAHPGYMPAPPRKSARRCTNCYGVGTTPRHGICSVCGGTGKEPPAKPPLTSDLTLIRDVSGAFTHPAWDEFTIAMRGKAYGREALIQAWSFFRGGYEAAKASDWT